MSSESGKSVPRSANPIVVGIVGSPHGVRGTVRVRATGSGVHLREGVEPVIDGVRRRILRSRETPKGFLLDFEGVSDRPKAKMLRGEELVLDRADLDEPEEDEVYVGDLVGLEAVDESGETIGVVAETFETPAHEVLVVRGENDDVEHYVPFTLEHVPQLDLETRHITVRLPEEQT